jgi:hypothetical protein
VLTRSVLPATELHCSAILRSLRDTAFKAERIRRHACLIAVVAFIIFCLFFKSTETASKAKLLERTCGSKSRSVVSVSQHHQHMTSVVTLLALLLQQYTIMHALLRLVTVLLARSALLATLLHSTVAVLWL